MKRNGLIGKILILAILMGSTALASPISKSYTSADAPEIRNLFTTSSDSNGIFYFGTRNGLAEFDGAEWTTNSIPNGELVRATQVLENRIFVGARSEFGWFEISDRREKVYRSLKSLLPKESPEDFQIMSIHASEDEVIFFSSQKHLFQWKNEQLSYFPVPGKGYAIAHGEPSNLFVQVQGSGLYKFDGDSFNLIISEGPFVEDRMPVFVPLEKDDFLAGFFEKGLYRVTQNFESSKLQWSYPTQDSEFRFICATKLQNGTIALGSINAGAVILNKDGTFKERFMAPKELPSNSVYAISETDNGALIVVQSNGVTFIEPSTAIRIFGHQHGVPPVEINDFELLGLDRYLATNSGLYRWRSTNIGPSEQRNQFDKIDSGTSDIQSILSHRDHLIFGGYEGIYQYNPQTGSQKKISLSAPTLSMAIHGNDLLLVGTYAGIFLIDMTHSEWKILNRLEWPGLVTQIKVTADGNVWFRDTQRHIARWPIELIIKESPNIKSSNTEVVRYNEAKGLPISNSGLHLSVIEDSIWVSSANKGVYKYNPLLDKFEKSVALNDIFKNESPPSTWRAQSQESHLILGISNEENRQKYWIGILNDGPQTMLTDIVWTELSSHYFQSINGPPSGMFMDMANREVILTGSGRILIVQPDNISMSQQHPDVLIRSVTSISHPEEKQSSELMDEARLSYKERDLLLKFSSPRSPIGDVIEYQFKVSGVDDRWSGWFKETQKEFPRLPPGVHEIQIRARGINGEAGLIKKFSIEISPPLYASPIALITYFVVIFFMLVYLYLLRTKSLRRRNARLKVELEHRTLIEKEARGQSKAISHSLEMLNTNPSFDGNVEAALQTLCSLMGVESAAYWQYVEGSQSHLSKIVPAHKSVKPGEKICLQEYIDSISWTHINDINNVVKDGDSVFQKLAAKSILLLSLTHRGLPIGSITLQSMREEPFEQYELELAKTLSQPVGLAVQLQNLSRSVSRNAMLEERNRLAQEIHDTLAQNFLAIRMQAQVAIHNEQGSWEKIEEMSKDGIEHARRMISDLMPDRVDEIGLRSALLEWLETKTDRPENLKINITESLPDCTPATDFALFRIAQEALQNAFKHASANNISIDLKRIENSLILEIKDDGIGFNVKDSMEKPGHFGLTLMKQRLSRHNGVVKVTSSPGLGTTLHATVPVKQGEDAQYPDQLRP